MTAATVHVGDCVEVLASLPAGSIDAIVTDPPYGLEFMGKEWDRLDNIGKTSHAGPTDRDPDSVFGRQRVAYSGSSNVKCACCDRWKWDHVGRRCECGPDAQLPNVAAHQGRLQQAWHERWAAEALRVLKPGGHLLAFGGTRTYHRLTCAIEDAGFEIRDCLAWLYGSGFPKSLDVGKAIDKAAGIDREDKFEGSFERRAGPTGNRRCDKCDKWLVSGNPCRCPRPQDAPVTAEAREHHGKGTALKPAHEPIVLARKPLAGTVAANVLEHGTGALNIDACRVGFRDNADENETKTKNRHADYGSGARANAVFGEDNRPRGEHGNYNPPGRWPANVILDPEAAALLDQQTGELTAGRFPGAVPRTEGIHEGGHRAGGTGPDGQALNLEAGGASRFFYCAKASSAERNAGLDAFEEQTIKLPGKADGFNPQTGKLTDGYTGARRNVHPTVKPVELMRWLVRLVTPPNGTVLDPFTGSGTTGCAATLEHRHFIGIERDPDYARIAEARIEWWAQHPDGVELTARLQAEHERRTTTAAGQDALFA